MTGAPRQPGTQQADARQSAPAGGRTVPGGHGKGREHGHQNGPGNDDSYPPPSRAAWTAR